MKLRFGLMICVIGTVLWTGAMYSLNKHFGGPVVYQSVAGASTSVTSTPDVTTPLTDSINTARTVQSKTDLIEDTRLNDLARLRLEDMIARKYYAHTDPSGADFTDVLDEVGLLKSTYSCENLLLTNAFTPDVYVTEWLESPAHADCMLNQRMTRVGSAEGLFDERTGQRLVVTIYAQSR